MFASNAISMRDYNKEPVAETNAVDDAKHSKKVVKSLKDVLKEIRPALVKHKDEKRLKMMREFLKQKRKDIPAHFRLQVSGDSWIKSDLQCASAEQSSGEIREDGSSAFPGHHNSSYIFNNVTNNYNGVSPSEFKQYGLTMKLGPLTASSFKNNLEERFNNSIVTALSKVVVGNLTVQFYNLGQNESDNSLTVGFVLLGGNDEFVNATTVKRSISGNITEIRSEFPELKEVGEPEESDAGYVPDKSDGDDDEDKEEGGFLCAKLCFEEVAFGMIVGVVSFTASIAICIYKRKRKARTTPGQTPQISNMSMSQQAYPPNYYLQTDYLPAYGNSQTTTRVPQYPA
eukprot:Nk52_evm61s2118 gene=Nk52_evmTU61s2118